MKLLAAVSLLVMGFSALCGADTSETVYVDTGGNVISESSIGEFCRPMETLPNGTVMVFSKSASDLAMYEQRLLANGVTDYEERMELVQAASNDDCARKAGNNCSAGKCSTGTCKQKYTGGMTSCSCQ